MTDNTLADLLPSIPFAVGGERMSLRPVVFRELPLAQRVMQGWGELVASGGTTIPGDAWDAFVDLICGACERPRSWVDRLVAEDFERLVSYVLAINRDIWDPEKSNNTADDLITWAEIAQRLVAHGHPWESLTEFSLSQLRTFLTEAMKQERERLALDITAASFAMADGKSVQKATKELRRVR